MYHDMDKDKDLIFCTRGLEHLGHSGHLGQEQGGNGRWEHDIDVDKDLNVYHDLDRDKDSIFCTRGLEQLEHLGHFEQEPGQSGRWEHNIDVDKDLHILFKRNWLGES